MKKVSILLLFVVALSCAKEQEEPIITDQTLHYDGPNQSAPILARGISYPAIKFTADYLAANNQLGKRLKQIDFHLTDNPARLKILIFDWNQADPNLPGDLLFEKNISQSKRNAWNSEILDTNLLLPENGIWVAFEIDAGDEDLRVIGCDAGPRNDNGNIYGLFGDNNPGWTDFYSFSQEQVDINWNIRLNVE